MAAPDPLSKLYAALWTAVKSHPSYAGLVKEQNEVHFDSDDRATADPKRQLRTADLPELLLTYETTTANIRSTSSSSSFEVQWAWVITTGDMRIDEHLLPISWMITEAMVAGYEHLKSLTWYDYAYVKKIDLLNSRAGETEALRRAGIRGWASALFLRTNLTLPTADMIAAAGIQP